VPDHRDAGGSREQEAGRRRGIADLVAATQADELMLTAQIFDHDARLHSFEIAAGAAAKP
jgi:hypothetical protein